MAEEYTINNFQRSGNTYEMDLTDENGVIHYAAFPSDAFLREISLQEEAIPILAKIKMSEQFINVPVRLSESFVTQYPRVRK